MKKKRKKKSLLDKAVNLNAKLLSLVPGAAGLSNIGLLLKDKNVKTS